MFFVHPFAMLDPSFLTCVTCPHLQVQLRGLEASILQTRQVIYTALHYTLELLTTFGLMHAARFDSAQLAAELRGRTSFPDPRIFPPTSSFSTRTTTSTSHTPLATANPFDTTGSDATDDIFRITTVPRTALSRRMDRSRSRSRVNPR